MTSLCQSDCFKRSERIAVEAVVEPVETPAVIHLPGLSDERGYLSWLEGKHLPFPVRRVYLLTGARAGVERGAHAHKTLTQIMLALAGPLEVQTVGPAGEHLRFELHPFHGALYIPKAHWRSVRFLADVSVCLVLASAEYDESDYIRDFDEFLRWSECK